jgi:uncharacterized membrane protein YfcA
MPDMQFYQWGFALVAAFLIGLSKTGIQGLGALPVAIFASILPARVSTGVVLPLLICGDMMAVTIYHRHAVWPHLWKLFPWAAFGIVVGFVAMDHVNDEQVRRVIGCILIALIMLQVWRQRRRRALPEEAADEVPHSWWFAPVMGTFAGVTTMMSNAAGPIMILYMLAMRLPKMEFMGTGAWYFAILNIFKVPFSLQLGLINPGSLGFNLALIPSVIVGTLLGRIVLRHINQKWFEILALVLTFLASLRLVLA